jgi:hypothetical protein
MFLLYFRSIFCSFSKNGVEVREKVGGFELQGRKKVFCQQDFEGSLRAL